MNGMVTKENEVLRKVLPQEMLVLHQWVNWRYEVRKGKQTKIPYNPHTLMRASSTDSRTWGTFEQALSRTSVKTHLGFVLTPPYIGIDLDHCVDEGAPNLLAREVVARFPLTYAEYSPSGTGIHLFVRGVLSHAHKTALGEMYTTARYFTVTGNSLTHTHAQVSTASDEEIAWLAAKLTPKALHKSVASTAVHPWREEAGEDNTPLGTDSLLYSILRAANLNWEITWDCTRKLEGVKDDQTASAREMSLSRMAFLEDVDDKDILRLLVGWRIDQRLPPKHHKALVSTIEKAHHDFAKTEQDKLLDDPETLQAPKSLTVVRLEKLLGLSIARIVQMGSDDARFRVHLTNGHVRDMGGYETFKSFALWEKLVVEQGRKHLRMEKKTWVKIFALLFTLIEVEESEETGASAETRAWLESFMGKLTCHPATYDTLAFTSPFMDETGAYIPLDAFHHYTTIKYAKISRGAMAGRLKVLGWEPVRLTRVDEKRGPITENYWHKAP